MRYKQISSIVCAEEHHAYPNIANNLHVEWSIYIYNIHQKVIQRGKIKIFVVWCLAECVDLLSLIRNKLNLPFFITKSHNVHKNIAT